MSKQNFQYLITVQYLGYRYSGWQKQPDTKTLQGQIDRTISFLLGEVPFKTLGASRTDAKVSANQSAFSLFTETELDCVFLLEKLNHHLALDLRILDIKLVSNRFNIIKDVEQKEYLYLFSFGQKNHPFSASLMVSIPEQLDIELMKRGARLFEGRHHFQKYCIKPTENTQFEREILLSEIVSNDIYTANFFPTDSYLFRVKAKGFLRNQIRLMMGALFCLGKAEISLDQLALTLLPSGASDIFCPMAPAPGLILNKIDFTKTLESSK